MDSTIPLVRDFGLGRLKGTFKVTCITSISVLRMYLSTVKFKIIFLKFKVGEENRRKTTGRNYSHSWLSLDGDCG